MLLSPDVIFPLSFILFDAIFFPLFLVKLIVFALSWCVVAVFVLFCFFEMVEIVLFFFLSESANNYV